MAGSDSGRPPLDGTTLKTPSEAPPKARSAVPCLTICCHADLSRIGERAMLSGLMVRNPVEVSRLALTFQPVGGGTPRPLEDPYVSRTPLRITGDLRRGLQIDDQNDDLEIDGAPVSGAGGIDRERLKRGVLLELAGRVLMLLHMSEGDDAEPASGLLGASDGIVAVRREVDRVAELEVPVLIRGESGSGKERVAQLIHERSKRRDAEHVAVNMATIPATTAVSTLFGHARGAFTGAQQKHVGLFERADGGTLFLDEIGETPDEVQPMLLRVLETGHITPLGESRERPVDVRVIAATDADLEQDMEEGQFRRALLHRLAGYEVRVPPLRERRDDIPRLLVHFLREELETTGHPELLASAAEDEVARLPTQIVRRLMHHHLDGNVRQLRNFARHLAIASRGLHQVTLEPQLERMLDEGDSGPSSIMPPPGSTESALPPPPAVPPTRRPTEISDLDLIAALEANRWAPGRTAAALGIPTSTLHDLIRKCPSIRKAKDIDDDELRAALEASGGDTERAAADLRVSERALRMQLKERRLLPG